MATTRETVALGYIVNVELRQAIESQLNKVELANRFARAVAVGNPREFRQADKEEHEIGEACNRLIQNSIICWNYLYLPKLERMSDYDQKEGCYLPYPASLPCPGHISTFWADTIYRMKN